MKRDELINFAKGLRSWGICIPSDILECSIDEYLKSISPKKSMSKGAELKDFLRHNQISDMVEPIHVENPYADESRAELASRTREYLNDVACGLRDVFNIHEWHVVEVPRDEFPNGMIIDNYVGGIDGDAELVKNKFGAFAIVQIQGLKFLLRGVDYR